MHNSTAPGKQLGADAVLVLVTFFWGLTFVLVKDAIQVVDVFAFLGQRFTFAAVFMLPFLMGRIQGVSRRVLARGALLGVFLFGAFALQTLGLLFTSASNAAFVTGLNVIFVPVLGGLFFGRVVPWRIRFSVVLATVGLFLLTTGGRLTCNQGDVLVVGCAVCIALHILLTGRYAAKEDVYWLTCIQLGVVGLLSSATGWIRGTEVFFWEPGIVWALLICIFFASIFAFAAQTAMQRFTTPTRTALIFCMEPVFGAVFAGFLAGERIGLVGYSGAAVILCAMILAELPGQWGRRTRIEAGLNRK
ncbi:MAG: DMT family transporter [Desulfovibrionales bacterium]